MTTNAIDILKEDHKNLILVMDKLEEALNNNSDDYVNLFQDFKKLFSDHDDSEDKILYPALIEYPELNKLILKGYQAHHMVKVGLLELRIAPYKSEAWEPKFLVIKDSLLAHMSEEENKIFSLASTYLDQSKLENLGNEIVKARS